MKSERRHDLKTNSLAKGMTTLPGLAQQYGSRVLLGIILCLLVYVLVYRWTTGKSQRATAAGENLAVARVALNSLRNPPVRLPPKELAGLRDQAAKEADAAIRDALTNAEDPKFKAEVLITRGDLNWQLANYPAVPSDSVLGSSGRAEKSPEEYLKAAEESYRQVLAPPLNEDHQSVTTARFGLAAIAENRNQWVEARKDYQQIIDDPATPDAFKTQATERLEMTKKLEKPVFLGGLSKPEAPVTLPGGPLGPFLPPTTTAPSTQPATGAAPAPASTAGPTTRPVDPTSAPAPGPGK
ncbi:MAG: hypothetical protein JWO87_3991 [Phycisphaerales bacterium]|nr:hypothetical protein [Phycisphaerales bacterium]